MTKYVDQPNDHLSRDFGEEYMDAKEYMMKRTSQGLTQMFCLTIVHQQIKNEDNPNNQL